MIHNNLNTGTINLSETKEKFLENIFNEYGLVTKTTPNGLSTKDTGFWITGVKE